MKNCSIKVTPEKWYLRIKNSGIQFMLSLQKVSSVFSYLKIIQCSRKTKEKSVNIQGV